MTGHLADDSFVALALGELAPAERDASMVFRNLSSCMPVPTKPRGMPAALRTCTLIHRLVTLRVSSRLTLSV